MRKQTKLFLIVFAIAATLISTLGVEAFISSAQIAKNLPIGLSDSDPSLIWEKTFGGNGDDRAFYAAKAGGGYVVVGSSTSFVQGKTVACMVMFDGAGNQIWNSTFRQEAGAEFRFVQPAADGFLAVGSIFASSGRIYGLVVKVDLQGNPVWNVTLKESEGVNRLFSGVKDASDFIVAGLTQPDSAGTSSAWLVKLDQDGNVIWNRSYAESNDTAARAITMTQDGCYAAAGYIDVEGNGNYNFLALKVNSDGSLLWNKTYGGTKSDQAYAVTSSPDGCIIAGKTFSFGQGDSDAWIVKTDLNGTLVWNKTVGGKDYDSPSFIAASPDGGYLVTGTTFSFGNGLRDFWLFKVDDAGKTLWSCTVGRSGYEEAYAAVYVGNGNYVLAGWTSSIGNGGKYDFYIIKIAVKPSNP
jgi:hypothetical protein